MSEERETVDLATYDFGRKIWIERDDGTIVSVAVNEVPDKRK